MALRKVNFPDGFISEATPSVVSVVGIKVETFEIMYINIFEGFLELAETPEQSSTVSVTWNGLDQYQGSARDFTVSANKVYFTSNLLDNMDVGDLIQITYQ